ncbi:MAG: ATP-binding protein [Byssovorax sp.]
MSSAPPSTATPSKAVPSLPAPSAPVPSGSGRPAPYKLFDYFDEDDKDRFYGREQDIEEIVDRIAAGRTLVLYGRSGIGKTSLLRAGVIPRLAARGFQVAYVRLLRAPLADLRAQVAAALGAPQGSLASMLRARREPVVILLDQLEELFIRFPDEAERRALAEELSASLTATDEAGRPLDLRLVLSLRQDWVAELDELGPTFADLLDRRYRLKGLSAFGARRAIAQPLAEKKIAVAPGLVNALVDDLSDKGFDPLLLQILCSEVYRAAERRDPAEIRLTVEDYQAVGGTAGIFLRYLDGVTAAVPEGERILLRLVLDALITEERTKRAMTLDGLLAARFRAERGEVHAVLERLRDGRLLRTMPRGDETWYELVHDRLVEVVLGWLERDRDFVELRFARSLVEELAQSGRWRDDPHALLSRGQIESAIGPYRGYLRLAEEEEAFLLQSAVVARSEEELGFWAARVGLGRSAERVLALCDHEVASVRGGAAWACSALPERDPRFAARCLLLSLHDPDGGVRRTAGKSFAIIATDAEIARLRADMEAPATRAAATELLADVIRRDRSLTGFSRRQRAAARRVAEKRVRVRFSEELSVRERTGAITGAIAAAVWVATIGLALAASTTILIDPTDYTTDVVWSIIVALPLIVAPAAGAADLAVRAAFYAEHLDRRSGLSRIARSRAVAPWYAVPLFICSVFPALEALGQSGVGGWLIMIAAALAITAITVSVVSASVAIGERALAERSSAAAVAGAALGAALGLPLGVPSLAARALMGLVPWHSDAILAGGALAAAAGSA